MRLELYKNIPDDLWNDWRWQVRNVINTYKQAKDVFKLNSSQVLAFEKFALLKMPFAVTPYFAGVATGTVLEKTLLPDLQESYVCNYETNDPLGEECCTNAPNILHKYKNRALFLVDNFCPTYCRYCTRGRLVAKKNFLTKWDEGFKYIEQHSEIVDVLISGGEPLMLGDKRIDDLLARLKSFPHIKLLRIGTRVPITLPQRITPQLVEILKKYSPVYFSIHVNHPLEITPEVEKTLAMLADAGVILGSQTVLLKGINDDSDVLYDLFYKLLENRVRPYYLFQCDPITGSSHFRVPIKKGLEIVDDLHKRASGYALPSYAIDIPNRHGKIELLPNHIVHMDDDIVKVMDYDGQIYDYPA